MTFPGRVGDLLPLPRRFCFISVCLQDYAKTTGPIFTKFSVKVAREARKKLLELGGHHITLGFQLSQWEHCHIPHGRKCVT